MTYNILDLGDEKDYFHIPTCSSSGCNPPKPQKYLLPNHVCAAGSPIMASASVCWWRRSCRRTANGSKQLITAGWYKSKPLRRHILDSEVPMKTKIETSSMYTYAYPEVAPLRDILHLCPHYRSAILRIESMGNSVQQQPCNLHTTIGQEQISCRFQRNPHQSLDISRSEYYGS